jgi:hypothetical protein
MKSKALRKKLTLNKKTIADLTIGKMLNIHGGMNAPAVEDTDRCPGATATSCNCTDGPTGIPGCPACNIC